MATSNPLDHFRFEIVPEKYARYGPTYVSANDPYPYCPPYYEIEVQYGGQKYQYRHRGPLVSDEVLLTTSFLEHLIRSAVEEFKRCVNEARGDSK